MVHHSPTPRLADLTAAVIRGASHPELEAVEVVAIEALEAASSDVLAADAYVLGTPANLGYMSGALKHFFDSIYMDSLDVTAQRPYGFYVHGATDTTGAVLAIEKIALGLKWQAVSEPVTSLQTVTANDLQACEELGATVAARLLLS